MPRKRVHLKDPTAELARQLQVLRLRMCWPPRTTRQIADELKVAESLVIEDLEFLKTKFTCDYFAKTNYARVARAVAEMEVIAFQILSDIQKLHPRAFAGERSSLYGKALSALQARNQMMLESGMIHKAAQKVEIDSKAGVTVDITTTSVEERLLALQSAKASVPVPNKDIVPSLKSYKPASKS